MLKKNKFLFNLGKGITVIASAIMIFSATTLVGAENNTEPIPVPVIEEEGKEEETKKEEEIVISTGKSPTEIMNEIKAEETEKFISSLMEETFVSEEIQEAEEIQETEEIQGTEEIQETKEQEPEELELETQIFGSVGSVGEPVEYPDWNLYKILVIGQNPEERCNYNYYDYLDYTNNILYRNTPKETFIVDEIVDIHNYDIVISAYNN